MSLRILHLSKYLPGFAGGLEAVVAMMAASGRRLGHAVTIAGVTPPPQRRLERDVSGVRLLSMTAHGEIGPIALTGGYFRLADELARADVVHLHMPNPLAELAWLRQRSAGGRLVPVAHAGILRLPPMNKLWESTVQRRVLRDADRIVVCAPQMFAAWPFLTPFAERGVALPFAVSSPPPSSPLRSGKASLELLAVGRLVPYKGYDVLLAATQHLSGDWHLTIVGDGPERQRLQGLAGARVTIRTDVGDLEKHRLLAGCDVFVQPAVTRAECFGVSVVEAFAHGKPAVVSDLATGLAYLARGGACGGVTPVGDARSLANVLNDLLADPERRRQLGDGNRRFWQNHCSESAFDQRYAELLRRYAAAPAADAVTGDAAAAGSAAADGASVVA